MMGVLAGMYKGWDADDSDELAYEGSDGGIAQGVGRLSRTLRGTGGKRRNVSFMTARTEKGWLRCVRSRNGSDSRRTVLQFSDTLVGGSAMWATVF